MFIRLLQVKEEKVAIALKGVLKPLLFLYLSLKIKIKAFT